MLTRRSFLTAAALLAPVAALAGEPARIDLRKVHRLVTLGDSITQAGGRPGGYVWQIDQYLQLLFPDHKIEVVNAGISGHKSNDMLARFQRDVLDKKPDVVTISVGINDVWHGYTAEHPAGYGPNRIPLPDYRRNVEAMMTAAEKAGVRVVLFTTSIFEDRPDSPRNLRIAGYNDVLRELAQAHGAILADQNAAFMAAWAKNTASGGPKLTSDQVHFALPGDSLMARTALLAMGVSQKDLDRVEPQVLAKIPK
jgi:acyl-CoA thioesterase-1